MIAYLDSSAIIAIVLAEPGSAAARGAYEAADLSCSSALARVECAAAVARSHRRGRFDEPVMRAALNELDLVMSAMVLVKVADDLVDAAVDDAVAHGLCGFDAVHFTAARFVGGDDLAAVTGHRELLRAWTDSGITTIDINA